MLKRLWALTRVLLANLYEINELRYGKDRGKNKRIRMNLIVTVFIYLMIAVSMFGTAMTFTDVGMAHVVPMLQAVVCTAMTLMFTFMTAGQLMFNEKAYENAIILPVRLREIVLSRFFCVYINGLVPSAVTGLPMIFAYAIGAPTTFSYYIYSLIGLLVMPLGAIFVSLLLGAIVLAISSRMKNKSIIQTILSTLLILAIVLFSVNSGSQISPEAISKIGAAYIPASLYASAITEGNLLSFLLFVLISVVPIALLLAVIGVSYPRVCAALNASYFKGDYRMTEQRQFGVGKALYRRECKRLFSSSMYTMNFISGPAMAVVISAAMLIVGRVNSDLEEALPVFARMMPFLVAGMCMIPTTSVSISMEGKTFWVIKSMPVSSKDVFKAKMLVNLTIMLPAWLIACILLTIMARSQPLVVLVIWLMPLAGILFGTVLGLLLNIRSPMLTWQTEIEPVKQSSSLGITVAICMGLTMLPMIASILLPVTSYVAVGAVLTVGFAVAAGLMYRKVLTKRLIDIE